MDGSGDGICQRNRCCYWESWIDGQCFRRLIGRNISRKVAREIAVKLRSEIIAGNFWFGGNVKNQTFDEARIQFEPWVIANKKPHSVRSYKEGLRRFAESFSGNALVRFRRFLSKGLANAESGPGSVSG